MRSQGIVTLLLENKLEGATVKVKIDQSVELQHFSRQDDGGLNQHGFAEVSKRERGIKNDSWFSGFNN